MRLKQLLGAGVAGFLHGNFVAWVEQQPRTEVERLLRSADDDDLFGRAPYGACPCEIRGNGIA